MVRILIFKKAIWIIPLALFLALFFPSFSNNSSETKNISEATNISLYHVTKIIFFDVKDNGKPIVVTDKRSVQKFTNLMKRYLIKKESHYRSPTHLKLTAEFYDRNHELMTITYSTPLQINGNYYSVLQGGLKQSDIERFLKNKGGVSH